MFRLLKARLATEDNNQELKHLSWLCMKLSKIIKESLRLWMSSTLMTLFLKKIATMPLLYS